MSGICPGEGAGQAGRVTMPGPFDDLTEAQRQQIREAHAKAQQRPAAPPMTPAEELREAAKTMRERAEGATPGPWQHICLGSEGCQVLRKTGTVRERMRGRIARFGQKEWKADHADAEYVAGMSPPVAMAVADWLDQYFGWIEGAVVWEAPECTHEDGPCDCGPMVPGWYHSECDGFMGDDCNCFGKGLAVARVCLGTEGEQP